MNAGCKKCARIFHMRRLLKRHRCPECGAKLFPALLVCRACTSPDGRTWFALTGSPGFRIGVVTSTRLT
jgi:uncharacterized OB-fold protein